MLNISLMRPSVLLKSLVVLLGLKHILASDSEAVVTRSEYRDYFWPEEETKHGISLESIT